MTQEEWNLMMHGQHQNVQPLIFNLNGEHHQFGSEIPEEIEYLNIHLSQNMQVAPQEVPLIKQWLDKVIDNFTGEYATFNDVSIHKSDIKKFNI